MFISIEGIRGAGKTTLQATLAAHLTGRGYRVLEVDCPGGTRIGLALRTLLLGGYLPLGDSAVSLDATPEPGTVLSAAVAALDRFLTPLAGSKTR
jgi:thymidylate kinase